MNEGTNRLFRDQGPDLSLLGLCWDAIPDPRVGLADLDPAAMADYRKRVGKAKRLSDDALDEDDARLVDNLRLTEGDHLTRAAILLFHRAPERFVPGAHVRIGSFTDESDELFHDIISGDLITQVDKTMEVLLFKYLKAGISYPMPEPALREALLNAVVHRDYSVPAPIQIRVHDHRLRIHNPGPLREGWTLETLLGLHAFYPRNPNIANAFYWLGEIETWGRGIAWILRACRRAGTPEPEIRPEPGGLWFEFGFSDEYLESVGMRRQRGGR